MSTVCKLGIFFTCLITDNQENTINIGAFESRLPSAGIISETVGGGGISVLASSKDRVAEIISHTQCTQSSMRESDIDYRLWLGGDGSYKGSNGGYISRSICLENTLECGCVVDVKEDKLLLLLLHTHTMMKTVLIIANNKTCSDAQDICLDIFKRDTVIAGRS